MSKQAIQYTIRNVPASVHRVLRKRAEDRGASLNAFLVQVLEKEAGIGHERTGYDDLDALIGTWVKDSAVDRALKEQRCVKPKDWRVR